MSQTVKNPAGGDASGGGSSMAPKRPAVDHPDATSKFQRLGGGGGGPQPPKLPSALPPPKISMSFGAKKTTPVAAAAPKPPVKGISMKLGSRPQSGGPAPAAALKPKSMLAARAFGDDDSDDEDEMPPEAKMRMKNIGRETPTSAGPNSFGKTKIGFCDSKKKRELDQEESLAE